MSAARGYAEMRLQYIVDADQSEPDLAPIADVSKLPGFVEFTQSYGTAYDALRRGDTTTAQPLLGRLHDVRTAMMSTAMAAMMPEMVGEADVIEQELRALALLRRDSKADAVATLRKAAAQEDALPFEFGPPEIEKPSHELLGEVLLATGQPAEARHEFELALKRTPGRSLTFLDLARACRAAGDNAAATAVYRQLVAIGETPIRRSPRCAKRARERARAHPPFDRLAFSECRRSGCHHETVRAVSLTLRPTGAVMQPE